MGTNIPLSHRKYYMKITHFCCDLQEAGKTWGPGGGLPRKYCGCIFSANRRRKQISVNVSLFEFSNYIYILHLPFSKYIYLFVVDNFTPNRYSYPLTKKYWKHKKNFDRLLLEHPVDAINNIFSYLSTTDIFSIFV